MTKRRRKKSSFQKNLRKKFKRFKKKFGRNIFLWFLIAYVILLGILGFIFLRYTDKCLEEYEASQSTHYMDQIVAGIRDSVNAGQVPEGINFSEICGEFDDPQNAKNAFMDVATKGEITYQRAQGSYDTENPEYMIYAGESPLMKIKLTGVNPRVIFGILTVMDWNEVSRSLETSTGGNAVRIGMPEGFTAYINGIQVSESYKTGESIDVDLFQYAKEYCALPSVQLYNVPNVSENFNIEIYDNNGNPVDVTYEDGLYSAFYTGQESVPDEYRQSALDMAKTWSLFMSNDLSGDSHGFKTVASYLINGSYYYDMARNYATSIDITFVSAHTLADSTFTGVVMDDFVQYNEDCYSCHIYFEKNMILKTGRDMTDITDSTFIFVNYDDTDDGVDNKHWCIVDMIASTENE